MDGPRRTVQSEPSGRVHDGDFSNDPLAKTGNPLKTVTVNWMLIWPIGRILRWDNLTNRTYHRSSVIRWLLYDHIIFRGHINGFELKTAYRRYRYNKKILVLFSMGVANSWNSAWELINKKKPKTINCIKKVSNSS